MNRGHLKELDRFRMNAINLIFDPHWHVTGTSRLPVAASRITLPMNFARQQKM